MIGLLGLISASFSYCHALHPESVDRYAEITLTPTQLVIMYEVVLGINPTERAVKQLDADNNGDISDDERDAFVKARAEQYARNQKIVLGEKRLNPQFKLGDAYGFVGHNGIDVIKIDIGYLCTIPEDTPKGRAISFSYTDDNFTKAPGWKQMKVKPLFGVKYDGHVPYADYKPFDYEIIVQSGYYPSTESINIEVTFPAAVNAASDSVGKELLQLPERGPEPEEQRKSWELVVLSGAGLLILGFIGAILLRMRR